jgi:hypothetical protein
MGRYSPFKLLNYILYILSLLGTTSVFFIRDKCKAIKAKYGLIVKSTRHLMFGRYILNLVPLRGVV